MRASALSVLVVDDDPDYVDTTAALLRCSGYNVAVARSGQEAIAKAAALGPDVVLLELAMPGTRGYALAEGLRLICVGKQPLLVAVSGYGRAEDEQASREAGIDLHLVKPVEPAALSRLLDRCASDCHAGRPASKALGTRP